MGKSTIAIFNSYAKLPERIYTGEHGWTWEIEVDTVLGYLHKDFRITKNNWSWWGHVQIFKAFRDMNTFCWDKPCLRHCHTVWIDRPSLKQTCNVVDPARNLQLRIVLTPVSLVKLGRAYYIGLATLPCCHGTNVSLQMCPRLFLGSCSPQSLVLGCASQFISDFSTFIKLYKIILYYKFFH